MTSEFAPGFNLAGLRAMAADILADPPKKRGRCRGQFGAAILSAILFGWGFPGPLSMVDQNDRNHILTATSPALQHWLQGAWAQKLRAQAAQKLGLEGQLDTGVAQELL
eukprot:1153065-Pyramimonas_sp.AAC.1